MAGNAYKTLGQSYPAATTLTDLYTVPASTQTVVSSIIVCNHSGSASTFRISLAPAGAADANAQYLYFDVPIGANDTFVATIGIGMQTTDKLRCYSGNGSISFTAVGSEIS